MALTRPRTRPSDDKDLFSAVEPDFLTSPSTPIEKQFAAFHRANPHVYRALETRALELMRVASPKRIGIRMLWEVMRYDLTLQTTRSGGFKLNDHCCPLYARLLLFHFPDLPIELRERTERDHLHKPRRM